MCYQGRFPSLVCAVVVAHFHLQFQDFQWHSLIMCMDQEDLRRRADWDGASGASQYQLLAALHDGKSLPIWVMQYLNTNFLVRLLEYSIRHESWLGFHNDDLQPSFTKGTCMKIGSLCLHAPPWIAGTRQVARNHVRKCDGYGLGCVGTECASLVSHSGMFPLKIICFYMLITLYSLQISVFNVVGPVASGSPHHVETLMKSTCYGCSTRSTASVFEISTGKGVLNHPNTLISQILTCQRASGWTHPIASNSKFSTCSCVPNHPTASISWFSTC